MEPWPGKKITLVQVRQLFNNPNHRKLLARLVSTQVESLPNRYTASTTRAWTGHIKTSRNETGISGYPIPGGIDI